MFLDGTYFHGSLELPQNLKRSGGVPAVGVAKITQTVGENTLEWFIGKYEVECLRKILGVTLAYNFIEGMKSPTKIWIDLYKQIYREDCDYKYSPVANYVYYWIMRDAISKTTVAGEVANSPDNATRVTAAPKMVTAWNEMCPQIHLIRQFIFDNWEDYQDYAGNYYSFNNHCCEYSFAHINDFNI